MTKTNISGNTFGILKCLSLLTENPQSFPHAKLKNIIILHRVPSVLPFNPQKATCTGKALPSQEKSQNQCSQQLITLSKS